MTNAFKYLLSILSDCSAFLASIASGRVFFLTLDLPFAFFSSTGVHIRISVDSFLSHQPNSVKVLLLHPPQVAVDSRIQQRVSLSYRQ